MAKIIKPGITTSEIDNLCYEFINDHNAYSAPLYYRGFPKSCCTSANHVVCHGIPSDKTLKEGDILNVDVTAFKDGWHGDTSRMFEVGDVSVKAKKLIKTTYESMMKAIKLLKENVQLGDIGSTIQEHVEANGEKTIWMVEAGTPNTLFRRGIHRNTVPLGTEVIIDGFQAKDESNSANGRRITLANGETIFMGSSGTGAPSDGADPGRRP
mgnify:CR=1 FL=1